MSAPPVASAVKASIPRWLDWGSRVPWPLLYGFGSALAWIARRVLRYRLGVVRGNVAGAFAALTPRQRRRIERQYYRRLGELAVEVVKSVAIPPEELDRRAALRGLEVLRAELDAGRSVLVLAAHQCNWEWLLLALSMKLGYPVDAAYKPLHDPRSDRWMRAIRTRFGGTLVPAKELLAHLLRQRGPRVVAMVADQEPVTSDYQWWTSFLGRPTAFYRGPEKIAEVTRYAVAFASMRRIARGRYEVGFELMFASRACLEPGALTERYARLVEAQIRASPEDWTWSHRRWKLRRPVYSASASALDRESR